MSRKIERLNNKVVNFRREMNTTLEQIKPETLALIEKQAENLGLSTDEYLRHLLPPNSELALSSDASDDEFENDMTAFAEGTEDLPSYNSAYSREDIYFDHD